MAQEPTVPFRTTSLNHDVLLRDSTSAKPPASQHFSIPPGGQELELQPATNTPYDRYFGSVRAVISSLEPGRTSMAQACHLMKVGHSFNYVTRDPYRPDPPKLTEAKRAGDCKSKALWLYENLADTGALFVIGKMEKSARNSHAWVYWRSGGRWWVLDCTERTDLIAADSVSSNRYVPYYSFGRSGTYRHEAARLNGSPKGDTDASPATGGRNPLR
jgi:hypothetical protein